MILNGNFFMATNKSNIYVDNGKFLKYLTEYKEQVKEAKKLGKTRPQIPDTIGECFMLIARHRSTEHNFVNYPFKEDMISDGVVKCIEKVENFDPKVSLNPFYYFFVIRFSCNFKCSFYTTYSSWSR